MSSTNFSGGSTPCPGENLIPEREPGPGQGVEPRENREKWILKAIKREREKLLVLVLALSLDFGSLPCTDF